METLQIDILKQKAKKLLEELASQNLISIRSADSPFQKALKKLVSRCNLWRHINARFSLLHLESWDQLYSSILDPPTLIL
jgi:hypothetical protein